MVDMRRCSPEPLPGAPRIEFRPGLANEMLHELAPLLAEEGIDILVLARKGRAFRSLDTLLTRQGGQHVLYGSALALAATLQTWSADTDTPVAELAHAAVH